jgi:hypothetical protein
VSAAKIVQNRKMARPKRFELLTPRFVVWVGPLKSLKSVTVRKPLVAEIGLIRQLSNGLCYPKNERHSYILNRCEARGRALHW